mmetsp:Transcript_24199/g.43006  ORF Transcript_24199/g.43006 Transcript_24199/m.43006 type:complete len:131 (-) Transcript_24199:592-984(-)
MELLRLDTQQLSLYEACHRAHDLFVNATQMCEASFDSVAGVLKVLPIDFAGYQVQIPNASEVEAILTLKTVSHLEELMKTLRSHLESMHRHHATCTSKLSEFRSRASQDDIIAKTALSKLEKLQASQVVQ